MATKKKPTPADPAVETDAAAVLAEKVKRPRVKGEVLIQTAGPDEPSSAAAPVYTELLAGPFADVAAAVAHIRKEKIVGRLRIVAVRRTLTVEAVQTTVLRLT